MTNTNGTEGDKAAQFFLRSYIAFVLARQMQIIEWLTQLDGWTQNSPGFFASKPVVLDLTALQVGQAGIRYLLEQLAERNIRIIGIEGADGSQLNPSLPPQILTSGGAVEYSGASDAAATNATNKSSAAPLAPDEPPFLLIETPIRSGQTVFFPSGDVTVLGSGSEIVAGGSIHMYGRLRGRAVAGSQGNARAPNILQENEAELLARYYRTAEEVDAEIRSQPVQSWLEDGMLRVASLE